MIESYLENSFGSVTLHIVPVDDDLYDSVPDLLRDVVACYPDQI